MLLIKLMRGLDLLGVDLDSEARAVRNTDFAVDNLKRLLREPLPILPNPVSINGGDFPRSGGSRMGNHGKGDVEVVVRMGAPCETPFVTHLSHAYRTSHCPEMRVGQRYVHGVQLNGMAHLAPVRRNHIGRRRKARRSSKFGHDLASRVAILSSARVFGIREDVVATGAEPDGFRE